MAQRPSRVPRGAQAAQAKSGGKDGPGPHHGHVPAGARSQPRVAQPRRAVQSSLTLADSEPATAPGPPNGTVHDEVHPWVAEARSRVRFSVVGAFLPDFDDL